MRTHQPLLHSDCSSQSSVLSSRPSQPAFRTAPSSRYSAGQRCVASAPPAYRPESRRQQWRFMSGARYSWWKKELHRYAGDEVARTVHCAWTQTGADAAASAPVCSAQVETTGTAWCWLQEHVQDSATRQEMVERWQWSDVAEDLLEQLEQRRLLCVRWELEGMRVPDLRIRSDCFSWCGRTGVGSESATAAQHPLHVLVLPEDVLEQHRQRMVVWLFFERPAQMDAQAETQMAKQTDGQRDEWRDRQTHQLLLNADMLTAAGALPAQQQQQQQQAQEVYHV